MEALGGPTRAQTRVSESPRGSCCASRVAQSSLQPRMNGAAVVDGVFLISLTGGGFSSCSLYRALSSSRCLAAGSGPSVPHANLQGTRGDSTAGSAAAEGCAGIAHHHQDSTNESRAEQDGPPRLLRPALYMVSPALWAASSVHLQANEATVQRIASAAASPGRAWTL